MQVLGKPFPTFNKCIVERKDHWENVYQTKQDTDVSWYQEEPTTSLNLIEKYLNVTGDAFIDVGGGNSNVVAELLQKGYQNLTVLDISKNAISRTRNKIGEKGDSINWIESNILDFEPQQQFQVWHDRATFHFLTDEPEINQYVQILKKAVLPKGKVVLATFSESGPIKCSGLEICQYSSGKIERIFGDDFNVIESFKEVHTTPFDTEQNFEYFVLEKKGE